MKTNPETTVQDTNIINILKEWDHFVVNDGNDFENIRNPKIELIQEAGEKNDGERQEMGSVFIYDLIENAQLNLRNGKGTTLESRVKQRIVELKEELHNERKDDKRPALNNKINELSGLLNK